MLKLKQNSYDNKKKKKIQQFDISVLKVEANQSQQWMHVRIQQYKANN